MALPQAALGSSEGKRHFLGAWPTHYFTLWARCDVRRYPEASQRGEPSPGSPGAQGRQVSSRRLEGELELEGRACISDPTWGKKIQCLLTFWRRPGRGTVGVPLPTVAAAGRDPPSPHSVGPRRGCWPLLRPANGEEDRVGAALQQSGAGPAPRRAPGRDLLPAVPDRGLRVNDRIKLPAGGSCLALFQTSSLGAQRGSHICCCVDSKKKSQGAPCPVPERIEGRLESHSPPDKMTRGSPYREE